MENELFRTTLRARGVESKAINHFNVISTLANLTNLSFSHKFSDLSSDKFALNKARLRKFSYKTYHHHHPHFNNYPKTRIYEFNNHPSLSWSQQRKVEDLESERCKKMVK